MEAICAICGPVLLKHRGKYPDGTYRVRCENKVKEERDKYNKSDSHKAAQKRFRTNHLEAASARGKNWYQENKEDKLRSNKKWKEENKEHYLKQQKEYHETYNQLPHTKAAQVHNAALRRARISKSESDITSSWLRTLKDSSHKCLLCNKEYINKRFHPQSKNLDHIIPIVMGGTHTKDNVRYVCQGCNLTRPKDGSDRV